MTLPNRLFRCAPRALFLVLAAAGILSGMAQAAPFTVAVTMSPLGPGGYLAAGTKVITATFSEAVNPLTTPVLAIVRDSAANGNSLAPTLMDAVGGPTPTTRYTATWSILTDNGADIRDGDSTVMVWGAEDLAGRPNEAVTTGADFVVDTLGPDVTLEVSPTGVVGGSAVDVTATFADPTSTRIEVAPTVTLVSAGAGPVTTLSLPPAVTMIRVDNLRFSARLGLASGRQGVGRFAVTGALDQAGNANLPVPSGADTVLVDTVPPVVTAVDLPGRPASVVPAGQSVLRVTFSEPLSTAPVLTVRPSTGSGGIVPTTATMTALSGGTQWQSVFTVSSGLTATFADVTVTGGADAAGNPVTPYTQPRAFAIDTMAPVLRSMAYSRNPAPAGPLAITATFSEPLAVAPSIAIDRLPAGFDPSDAAATPMSPTVTAPAWRSPCPTPLPAAGGPPATLAMVTLSGGADAAGNGSTAATTTFSVDTSAPTASFAVGQAGRTWSASGPALTTGPATITLTFTEAIASAPRLTVVRSAAAALTLVPVALDVTRTVVTATYTVLPADGATVFDGPVDVTVTSASDAAGNAVAAPVATRFQVDTAAPGVCLSWARGRSFSCASSPATVAVTPGVLAVTATFSEPLPATAAPLLDFASAGPCLAGQHAVPMTRVSTSTVWVASFTIAAGCNSLPGGDPVTMTLSGAADSAGNRIAALPVRFLVDGTRPALASFTSSSLTTHVPAGTLVLTATFVEPLSSPPALTVNRPPAATSTGDLSAVAMTPASTNPATALTWTVAYPVLPALAPGILDSEPGAPLTTLLVVATDPAGNSSSLRPNFQDPALPAAARGAQLPATTAGSAVNAGFQVDTTAPSIAFSFSRADATGTSRTGVTRPVDPDFVRAGFLDITATFTDAVATSSGLLPVRLTATSVALGTVAWTTAMGAGGSAGAYLHSRLVTGLEAGTYQLAIAAADLAGNRATVSGRSAYSVDAVAPREASFNLLPSRPVGATLTPTVVGQRNPSTPPVALSSGPVTVVVTFNEPIAVTASVAGLVPAPLTPTVELVRPRDGPGSTATSTTRWPLSPTVPAGSLAATVWTTVIAVPGRGLPDYEDGYSTWTLTTCVDRAGNSFTPRIHEAVIDTLPPVLRLPEPAGSLTAGNSVRVVGSASDLTGAAVQLSLLGSALTAATTVTALLPGFDLTLGPLPFVPPSDLSGLQLLLRAVDPAGNVATLRVGAQALDTDGDGLPDDFEARATQLRDGAPTITGLSPGGDDDADGLSNLQEYRAGTDPERADTDDDGVDDALELAASGQAGAASNPLDPGDARPSARLVRLPPSVPMAPQIVALDGRASRDPRSRTLGYLWTVLAAPAGAAADPFLGTSERSPVGYARLTTPGAYALALTVGNGSTFRSPPSTVVNVAIEDVAPRASAGAPLVFEATSLPLLTRLDGAASIDDNGQALTFAWRLAANPGGGASLSADVTGATPLLRVTAPGSYAAELTVTSGGEATSAARSSVATAWVVVHGPVDPATGTIPAGTGSYAPVARAGADQRRVTTAPVSSVDLTLVGHDSVDPQNPTVDPLRPTLDFFWTQLSGPAAAVFQPDARGIAAGSAASSVDPRVRLTAPGRYVFGLSVRRAGYPDQTSAIDSVTAEWSRLDAATGYGPAADAGLDRTVSGFDAAAPPVVELNGTASRPSPQTGGRLVYRWTQVRRGPFDLTPQAALDDASSPRPVLVPPAPGDYRFELSVSDLNGIESLPDSVLVQVRSPLSREGIVVSARAYDPASRTLSYSRPARIESAAGPLVTLDASGAYGAGALTYRWRQLFEHSTAAPVALSPVAGAPSRVTCRPVVSGNSRFGVTVTDGTISAEAGLVVPVDDWRAGRNAGVTPQVSYPAVVSTASDRLTAVTLDASGSFDRDRDVPGRSGYPVSYSWRQVGGPALLDFDRSAARPELGLPAGAHGTFTFELTVDDLQDAVLVQGIAFEARPASSTSAASTADLGTGAGEGGSFGGCSLGTTGGAATAADMLVMMMALGWLAWPHRRRGDRGDLR